MRKTIFDIQKMKKTGHRIAMLTAYDYPSALIAERAGVPMLLVGDSMGMVVQGYDTTIPVTLEDMIRHTQMVMRGSKTSLVVADLPFLTYGDEQTALVAAKRLMQEGGALALKLEGGEQIVPTVKKLTALGVPVMGHLGFTPQSQLQQGVRVQAKEIEDAKQLIKDALALEKAGAFGVVLELVPAQLAKIVSEKLTIPTIGIGAGAGCDGQVQVWHDLLGIFDSKTPRHARRFTEIGAEMVKAIHQYVSEVEAGQFPTDAQSASMPAENVQKLLNS
ncbi:3-methyl-2-oxobutanoate hydroxymethyltransferase [Swingsia samuiensis]|uniref:3-methyl-2-oxobutanoate hydroxymethyltransferase n=1 Tax=Swingsia samuiensis TaxID=1293412 RepID=A0A4Y6UI90_9PROT|nr:3-methyl-2-oxobutanoate hydroxymethyltransferase [Swingsia samuiensis]QDH17319.1 3-methyl-2-oxobutanoate hydroxymethyltransferase [Swingsia samuiensis]